jgi:organic radical activating enzyme
MKPISFDYRISNLCNFKCRMCGDLLSSQWEAERKILGVDEKREPFYSKVNQDKFKKFKEEVSEIELWSAVKDGSIEEIYWVGGEPLMWDIHWDVMKYLVDNGQSKNVTIRYNTNLSRISFKGQNLYDLLPYFKDVQVCASIDGTEEVVEYVRHGIKWNSWLDNFKQGLFLNELYGSYGITFDLTITSPGFKPAF